MKDEQPEDLLAFLYIHNPLFREFVDGLRKVRGAPPIDLNSTIQELTLSEALGIPVKIAKK